MHDWVRLSYHLHHSAQQMWDSSACTRLPRSSAHNIILLVMYSYWLEQLICGAWDNTELFITVQLGGSTKHGLCYNPLDGNYNKPGVRSGSTSRYVGVLPTGDFVLLLLFPDEVLCDWPGKYILILNLNSWLWYRTFVMNTIDQVAFVALPNFFLCVNKLLVLLLMQHTSIWNKSD